MKQKYNLTTVSDKRKIQLADRIYKRLLDSPSWDDIGKRRFAAWADKEIAKVYKDACLVDVK